MTRKSHLALAIALASAALVASPSVQAQPVGSDEASDALAPLRDCSAIRDDTARLACFDGAVGALLAAREQGDIRVVDREEVRKTRRRLFGFSLPDLGLFGDRNDQDTVEREPETLDTTIARVRSSDYTYLLETAEGAVWRLDEVPRRLMTPKTGQSLQISPGALGSYFLKIDGQPSVKGRRVR